jgi:hypothetical protein
MGYVEVGGLACPAEHEDSDIDYTQIADYPRWLQRGTTADGRAWYENEYTNSQFRFLYYSDRAEGWFITATAPDLDEDDPWVGGNNAARLVDAEGEGSGSGTPDGVYPNAMLYCADTILEMQRKDVAPTPVMMGVTFTGAPTTVLSPCRAAETPTVPSLALESPAAVSGWSFVGCGNCMLQWV